jgi:hypothetical protein
MSKNFFQKIQQQVSQITCKLGRIYCKKKNLIELLYKKHKHYKIAKHGHQHLIMDHTHLTNEKFYSRENEKNCNKNLNG